MTEPAVTDLERPDLEEDPILSVVHGPFGDPDQDHGPAGGGLHGVIRPMRATNLTVAWAAQRGLI